MIPQDQLEPPNITPPVLPPADKNNLQRICKNFKKGVDEGENRWYYSKAPCGKRAARTLKIEQCRQTKTSLYQFLGIEF